MNGFIEREITMNAGIYHKSVCDVCLNCRYARCVNVNDGCAEYREALKQHARKYRRRVESEELRVGGDDGSVRQRTTGETRIVWDDVVEELKCEACGAILHWNFGFRRCPYCGRKVTETQKRRIAGGQGHKGIIAR